MKRVIDGTGAGDPRYIIDKERADALISDNPGWASEAAFRHHEHPEAEVNEMEANQSIPTPLEEVNEPQMEHEQIGFREPTDHASS
ncbi:MAG TPA: hypothetical protein V6D05_18075 [Stenomitos sp.]